MVQNLAFGGGEVAPPPNPPNLPLGQAFKPMNTHAFKFLYPADGSKVRFFFWERGGNAPLPGPPLASDPPRHFQKQAPTLTNSPDPSQVQAPTPTNTPALEFF